MSQCGDKRNLQKRSPACEYSFPKYLLTSIIEALNYVWLLFHVIEKYTHFILDITCRKPELKASPTTQRRLMELLGSQLDMERWRFDNIVTTSEVCYCFALILILFKPKSGLRKLTLLMTNS